MANRYQYTVVELREGMMGGKMSGDKLEKVLNEHAAQGWQLKAITSVEVRGRVGPGGVEGLSSPLNGRSAELTSTTRARSSLIVTRLPGRVGWCRTRSAPAEDGGKRTGFGQGPLSAPGSLVSCWPSVGVVAGTAEIAASCSLLWLRPP